MPHAQMFQDFGDITAAQHACQAGNRINPILRLHVPAYIFVSP
jgi:hypothetical protein